MICLDVKSIAKVFKSPGILDLSMLKYFQP